MKVVMLVGMSGPEVVREPNVEYDIEEAEAKRLVAAGIAEPSQKTKAVKKAKAKTKAVETAATR